MQNPNTLYWIAILINIAFLLFSLGLAIKTDLIKDDSVKEPKSYSYAKAQLFWWTMIIISVFIWCAVFNQGVPQLTSLCLGLLGISVGTTAAGAMIDNTDKNTPGLLRKQDANPCRSFLKDILSDKEGNYNIHRFQSFIFNISIGIIFLWTFFNSDMKSFPDLGNTSYILGLLGISNLGYAGLKMGENAPARKDAVGISQSQGKTDTELANEMKLKAN
jgi:hypothetical protein